MKMNDGFSSFNRKIGPSLKIVTILAFLIIILTIPSINAVDLLMQGPNSPGTVVNDNSIGTLFSGLIQVTQQLLMMPMRHVPFST